MRPIANTWYSFTLIASQQTSKVFPIFVPTDQKSSTDAPAYSSLRVHPEYRTRSIEYISYSEYFRTPSTDSCCSHINSQTKESVVTQKVCNTGGLNAVSAGSMNSIEGPNTASTESMSSTEPRVQALSPARTLEILAVLKAYKLLNPEMLRVLAPQYKHAKYLRYSVSRVLSPEIFRYSQYILPKSLPVLLSFFSCPPKSSLLQLPLVGPFVDVFFLKDGNGIIGTVHIWWKFALYSRVCCAYLQQYQVYWYWNYSQY